MAEEYLRTRNRALNEYAVPVEAVVAPESRGVVNELGYRIFIKSMELRRSPEFVPSELSERSYEETLEYIRNLTQPERFEVPPLQEAISEATTLATNLAVFFSHANRRTRYRFREQSIIAAPVFSGCGWIEECAGDLLGSKVLFEVKAGDRNFRSIDLRQVLTYCALNFASKQYDIRHVCLVNPRLAVFLGESLERLCQEVAGRTSAEVLGDIVQYVSDPIDQYLSR
jgi:hypothetical protein